MPLYEYRCDGCRKVHEVMQKFSDAPLTECPECNGPVQKLISMSSFALKGTGWYTTDYKRSGSSASSTSGKSEGGESGSSAASTSGTAPSTSSGSGDSTPSKSGSGESA